MVIAMAPSPPVLAPTVTTVEPTPWDLLSLLRPHLRGCTMIFVDGMRLFASRREKVEDTLAIEISKINE